MAREEKIGCKGWKGEEEEERRVKLFSQCSEKGRRRKREGGWLLRNDEIKRGNRRRMGV